MLAIFNMKQIINRLLLRLARWELRQYNKTSSKIGKLWHHTIEICHTSQFAQHLRAILNLPLGDTSLIQCGSMINLVGEKGFEGPAIYEGLKDILSIPGVYPHIYGKEITKSFRKMGHVTITGSNMDEVREKTKKVQAAIRVIA